MKLNAFDWLVIFAYFAFNLGVGLYYRKRATKSTNEFFVGGRNVGWWLAGTSMVATTFAADTPLAVTGLVASKGIAGNWLWWNMLFSAMLTVFFFARLWRRSGVTTEVELAELRYSGKPAAFLRGFRAIYLGLPVNLIVMGWVNLAMVKILTVVFPGLSVPALGITDPKVAALVVVFVIMLLTASISALSGLWGVMVTDMFQFFLKMGMVIVLAYYAVNAAGGMGEMKDKLLAIDATKGHGSILSFVPQIGSAWMPVMAFCVYLGVQWWASWYPGAEPGGGGYIAQRMFSAKDEKNSLLATLWFSIAHYAIRPWPWILTALASVVLYPNLKDKESGFVMTVVDPKVFPHALGGLMVAAFAAAYMSTIATQLNWGASYLVSDVYRRFLKRNASDEHYIRTSQIVTLGLMLLSCVVTRYMDSISHAWEFLLSIGAGTGAVFILRWFWWRINAWSEISAMIASLVVSIVLKYWVFVSLFPMSKDDDALQFAYTMLITVGVSTVVWLVVTMATAPEDEKVLLSFYRRVRPNAALWGPIAKKATDVVPVQDGLPNLLDWFLGCVMIYMFLFGMGKIIFGDYPIGCVFLGIGTAAAVTIYRHLQQRGWNIVGQTEAADEAAV
ncbi:MAG: Na+:solute symporter [Fimbriimonas sp.]|nr:Na+:solute symporter [Fimbriimonas sp.]